MASTSLLLPLVTLFICLSTRGLLHWHIRIYSRSTWHLAHWVGFCRRCRHHWLAHGQVSSDRIAIAVGGWRFLRRRGHLIISSITLTLLLLATLFARLLRWMLIAFLVIPLLSWLPLRRRCIFASKALRLRKAWMLVSCCIIRIVCVRIATLALIILWHFLSTLKKITKFVS